MPERLRVAIIGCAAADAGGFLPDFDPAYAHALGYRQTGECAVVAVADWNREAGERLAARIGEGVRVYQDYQELLDDERPDIVSVCAGPKHQPSIVLDAASADVRAIHGELPLAPTWGEAKAMRKAAGQKGIQLTFNLPHRTLPAVRTARELIVRGVLGNPITASGACEELFFQGALLFDLFAFLAGNSVAEWVRGEVRSSTEREVSGVPVEDSGQAEVGFRGGGAVGLSVEASAGRMPRLHLVGDNGEIKLAPWADTLRYRATGAEEWQMPAFPGPQRLEAATARGIADLVQCLNEGGEPELAGHHALRAAECVFAAYESCRTGGPVALPLHTEDSAFLSMLAGGRFALGAGAPPSATV